MKVKANKVKDFWGNANGWEATVESKPRGGSCLDVRTGNGTGDTRQEAIDNAKNDLNSSW